MDEKLRTVQEAVGAMRVIEAALEDKKEFTIHQNDYYHNQIIELTKAFQDFLSENGGNHEPVANLIW